MRLLLRIQSVHGPSPLHGLLESILESLAGDHPWFVLSGSLPPGLPSTTYRDLTQRLRASGCPVLLDTSGEGLRHAFEASPNVIKPNQRELEEALDRKLPGESELCAVGSQLVNAGMDCVIVSRGAEGALFVNAQTTLAARHPGPAAIQSTVGAGDALVAGYLAARIREFDTEGTARLSVAFSVAALARVPGAPLSSSAIEAFAKEVSIAWR